MTKALNFVLILLVFGILFVPEITAQTTEFTYQGSLKDQGQAPTGNYDFEFRLYDSASGGTQIGSVISQNNVSVANGIFAVRLNFGAGFPGADRYLEIGVRAAGAGGFTPLNPRQKINSTPYALQSLNAANSVQAVNSQHLGGRGFEQYVLTTDPRLSGSGGAGSNYGTSTFNINGTGNAGIFNAATRFTIGDVHVLSNLGQENLFAGAGAGQVNTGSFNAFFGSRAGVNNKSGSNNSFFGSAAGEANTFGQFNSFFGTFAGQLNTVGNENSFFGHSSGLANITGINNSFFGSFSGTFNSSGRDNSFYGQSSGYNNNADRNSFFGSFTGNFNSTGSNNSFFGSTAGRANTTGSNNVFVGASSGSTNAVGSDNSFYGSNSGFANGANGGSFFGADAGYANVSGSNNAFFGRTSGRDNTTGELNTFLGTGAGIGNLSGSFNTAVGANANVGANDLRYATAIGAEAVVSTSNTIVLGRTADTVRVSGNLNVVGTFSANNFSVPASGITGVLGLANGGTGLSSAGPNGNFLRSDGTTFVSSPFLAADFPSGSANYIQNGVGLQAASNFNISGTGTIGGAFSANSVNSVTQYNIGGNRVFSTVGTNNVFAGAGTGTGGDANSFFGSNAGTGNATGSSNTILGAGANVAVGNLTFATSVGAGSVVGTNNTVVLGRAADTVRVPGNLNVVGTIAGTFSVPAANITGVIGTANGGTGLSASGPSGNILRSNGTIWTSAPFPPAEIPAGSAFYIQNGTTLQTPGNFNISGNGTLGGTLSANVVNSATNYNIGGNRVFSVDGTANVFAGAGTATTGSSNSFFGNSAGAANVSGTSNTIIGAGANVAAGGLINATAVGANALVGQNNSLVLGGISGLNGAAASTNVGIGTTTPKAKLDVTGGSILVGSPGQGVILKSPNGSTCRLLGIDNLGAMTLTAIPCP